MATITLSPELSERVAKAAKARGTDPESYLNETLTATTDADLREFEDACAGIARGLAQEQAGVGVEASALFQRLRSKQSKRDTPA